MAGAAGDSDKANIRPTFIALSPWGAYARSPYPANLLAGPSDSVAVHPLLDPAAFDARQLVAGHGGAIEQLGRKRLGLPARHVTEHFRGRQRLFEGDARMAALDPGDPRADAKILPAEGHARIFR